MMRDEPFCPLCHPERLPTEARLAQPAHAGHIAIRFDTNAHWLLPFLDGESLQHDWCDEVLCGDDGWALCLDKQPAEGLPGRYKSPACREHPFECLRRVLRGRVSVTRAYETAA